MRRLVCLDGLRGVLAFYVMLSHTLPFAPMPGWLVWVFSHGGAGVDVFFILSGLVIVQSLASFNYRSRPFLTARVARIYPVFLVVFVAAVAVQPLATGFERMAWIGPDSPARFIWSGGWPNDWGLFIAAHLTMTHGLFPDGVLPDVWVGFLGAAWSLSTEWQFYLLALLIGRRLGLRSLAWLFLAIAATAVAWHAVAPDAWQFSRAFLPNKAQYFALGIASAIVVRQGNEGLGAYLAVLVATLVAVCRAGRRGQDASAAGLVRMSGGAVFHPIDGGARRGTAIARAGLAGSSLVLPLSRQRTRAKAAGRDARRRGPRQRGPVHRALAARGRGSADSRGVAAARLDRGAHAALGPSPGATWNAGRGCSGQRRMKVQ